MKNKKLPIIQAFVFLTLLIVAGLLYYLLQGQLRDTNLVQAEINYLTDNREKLSLLSENLPGVIDETNIWVEALPANEEDVAGFAALIESSAKEKGLTISLDFDDFPKPVDIGGKMVPGLGLVITLEGSLDGVRRFMAELSRSNYFYKTDKITILKHETKDGVKAAFSGSLMMNLSI